MTGAEDTGGGDTGSRRTGVDDTGPGRTGAEDTGSQRTFAEETGTERTGTPLRPSRDGLRVLHAVTLHTPTGAFGGPVRVALNLTKGLTARGHTARLTALAAGLPAPLPGSVEGVPARLFPARRVLPLGFSGLTSPALLAAAGRLVRDADLVHVHLARDLVTLPLALAALRARTPLVVQTHGMVDPSGRLLARLLDAAAVRRVLGSAAAVLHLTEHERDALRQVAGERTPTLVRLVNGVPAQPPAAPPTGPPRILYAARLHARKRPQDLVAAAPAILGSHPDADFVVAGPDEGELAGVRQRAASLGLGGRVHFPGPLSADRMQAELCRAHVYVLPSVDEPFPMSVLEAMAVGTPVVVTRSNGLARAVEHAGAGRVVDGPGELAAAVTGLLDPVARAAAARAARALTAAEFSMDAVVTALLDVYGRAVAQSSRAQA